jgi:uncharacterized protein (TIGR03435 family)
MQKDDDGFPIITGVRGTYMVSNNGRMRMRTTQEAMPRFVELVTAQLGHPVTDSTGLKSKYDFILTFAMPGMALAGPSAVPSPDGAPGMAEANAAPDLIGALPQIGLKLVKPGRPPPEPAR